MRVSQFYKRFLSVGLLALIGTAVCLLGSERAETAARNHEPQARPPMFVLQVGIGKYVHAPPLTGAVNDVVEMRKVLESERYGIPSANIVTVKDEQGTKSTILDTFRSHLIAKARENFEKTKRRDAIVMFQFSGHGSQVPDVDGDEKEDNLDETLVTFDSDDKAGKNLDITDDEIYALTGELRRWTDNIVYIFDSCHSGSGTRDSDEVRRVPARKTAPVTEMAKSTRSAAAKPSDDGSGVLPPGDDYIVITAAKSGELASQKNCFEECGETKRPVVYGNLTFYLIDELKNARSDTSYRELMDSVTRRVVGEKPTQTPQIEGDKSRFVFGGLGPGEDNFVRIAEAETTSNGVRSLKIRAGAIQGLTPGTMISFYDKGVARFDGVEKTASGKVRSVSPQESVVDIANAKRVLTIDDKAVVLAPDLGAAKFKVDLDVDATKLSPTEKKVVAATRNLLTPKTPADRRDVELVSTRAGEAARWDVALLKDKFSKVTSKIAGAKADTFQCAKPTTDNENALSGTAQPDRDVFYLAGRDFVPLYGFCMEGDSAEDAAPARLQKALIHLAGLRSIRSIDNKRSALKGRVVVKPIKLSGDTACTNSVFTAQNSQAPALDAATGSYAFTGGDYFWFEVTNNSTKPLYAALLNTDPNGAVNVFSPRGQRAEEAGGVLIPPGGKRIIVGDDCRAEGGQVVEAAVLLASRTPGLDRFKFIFSTDRITYDDLAYLEKPALIKRTGQVSLASMSDWTTVETIFSITDTGN